MTAAFRMGVIASSLRPPVATPYAAAVLLDSPKVYWRTEETSGSTFADSSGNGFTGTGAGSVTSNGAPVFSGYSGSASATFAGGKITAATNPFAGAAALSMECVFNLSSLAADNYLMGRGLLSTDANALIRVLTSGAIEAAIIVSATQYTITSMAGLIATGTDYHVALSWSAATGIFFLTLNGAVLGKRKTALSNLRIAANPNAVAGQAVTTATQCTGRIDEIAFYEAALSLTRIQAHVALLGVTTFDYGSDANWSSVQLLLSGKGAAYDASDNCRQVGFAGAAALSTGQSKFSGGPFPNTSFRFNGSGNDALKIIDNIALSGDCTVEGFHYGAGTNQAFSRIFQTRDGDFICGMALFFDTTTSNLTLQAGLSSNGSSNNLVSANVATFTNGAWKHWAAQITGGASPRFQFFYDGTRVYDAAMSSSALYTAVLGLIFGGQSTGTSRSINGYLESIRVSSIARYSGSTITVPTARFPEHA